MYPLVTRRLNKGREIGAWSWPYLKKQAKEGIIEALVPLIDCYSTEEFENLYIDFVNHNESFVLPPILKQAVKDVAYDFRNEIEAEGRNPEGIRYKIELKEISGNNREQKKVKFVFGNVDPVEEHGLHLPLSTDSLIGYFLCELVSKRYEDSAIVPPIPYGITDELAWAFPGTIHIENKTLRKIVECHYSHWRRILRPETVVVFTAHGCQDHITEIKRGINMSGAGDCFVFFDHALIRYKHKLDHHAGGVETSKMLFIDRNWGTEFVGSDAENDGFFRYSPFIPLDPKTLRERFGWKSGVRGSAKESDSDRGRFLFGEIVGEVLHCMENPHVFEKYFSRV